MQPSFFSPPSLFPPLYVLSAKENEDQEKIPKFITRISPPVPEMDHKKYVVQNRKPLPVKFIAARYFSSHQRLSETGGQNIKHQGSSFIPR
jgi:hypothetical protein